MIALYAGYTTFAVPLNFSKSLQYFDVLLAFGGYCHYTQGLTHVQHIAPLPRAAPDPPGYSFGPTTCV